MPRTAVDTDVFFAIAEPRRREIIALLADERVWSVNELVSSLDLAQPTVSKHLSVLRSVGIVSVERIGKNRLYKLIPQSLKPVHAWAHQFEQMWSRQLSRVKERAEKAAAEKSKNN
jgi:DNA-binding transcriptional ArsR family regulator